MALCCVCHLILGTSLGGELENCHLPEDIDEGKLVQNMFKVEQSPWSQEQRVCSSQEVGKGIKIEKDPTQIHRGDVVHGGCIGMLLRTLDLSFPSESSAHNQHSTEPNKTKPHQ